MAVKVAVGDQDLVDLIVGENLGESLKGCDLAKGDDVESCARGMKATAKPTGLVCVHLRYEKKLIKVTKHSNKPKSASSRQILFCTP